VALAQRRDDRPLPDAARSADHHHPPPRSGEVDGVHYRFLDDDAFDAMVDAGEFVEWAAFNGRRYGTPWSSLAADAGRGPIVLEIDVQGAEQIRRREAEVGDVDATFVFLAPPSWEDLEARLRARGSETPDTIEARLRIGRDEVAAAAWFDHTVVNTTVDEAVAALERILGLVPERGATSACAD
jgi:guanylate kinase